MSCWPRPVTSTSASQHGPDGLQEDVHVEAQRPILDVVTVDPKSLVGIEVAPTRDLPQPRDSSTDLMAGAEELVVRVDLLDGEGARSHDAHVPSEHVPQLRQLVQAQRSERPPHASETWIVLQLEERLREVDGLPFERPLVVGNHRPELVHSEHIPVLRHTELREEYGAG